MRKIQHEAHQLFLPLWTKVRDCVAGEEVVKARGTDYLPMLASQAEIANVYSEREYDNYKMRAGFYGACHRTQMGLVGAVLRKEPSVEGVPDDMMTDIEDRIGLGYEALDTLVMRQLQEAVTCGRYLVMLDKGEDLEAPPYALIYRAEDVVFWAEAEYRGRMVPTVIALSQTYEDPKVGDLLGIETERKPEWLVLRFGPAPTYAENIDGGEGLVGAPADEWIYWQEIWRDNSDPKRPRKGDGLNIHRIIVPRKDGGRFWDEIPADVVNAIGGISLQPETPPMLALSNVVLAHYRGSADLEWGRHMTAIPQPYVTGAGLGEDDKLVVGCGYAWHMQDPGASVGYLEFSGAGLGHIAEGLKDKERQAAVLGARMLEEQSAGVEAAATVRLRQSGDRSVLATIAASVSEATTRLIQRYLKWRSPQYDTEESLSDVRYKLSSDFESAQLDPAELTALTAALQAGTISWETFAHKMRQGEMLPPGVSEEDERERIQAGAPGRARDKELAQLQADVASGRISVATYLAQIQDLGMLAGVDIAAEPDLVFEEKVKASEIQMMAFQQAGAEMRPGGPSPDMGGNFGTPAEPPAPEEEAEEAPPPPEAEEETEE